MTSFPWQSISRPGTQLSEDARGALLQHTGRAMSRAAYSMDRQSCSLTRWVRAEDLNLAQRISGAAAVAHPHGGRSDREMIEASLNTLEVTLRALHKASEFHDSALPAHGAFGMRS